jgi:hypothetical protein
LSWPSEVEQPKDNTIVENQAKEKIVAMAGQKVTALRQSSAWKVIASNDPAIIIPEKEPLILKGFNMLPTEKGDLCNDVWNLTLMDWKVKVTLMSEAVQASQSKTQIFSKAEFLIWLRFLLQLQNLLSGVVIYFQ